MNKTVSLVIEICLLNCLITGICFAASGTISAWGSNASGQCNVPLGNNYIEIKGGNVHSIALDHNGAIVAWGLNNYGQCDVPSGNDFIAIAAGGYHSLALETDGSLVAWGANNNGQCDVPLGDFIAIASGGGHNLALRSDGALVAWGSDDHGSVSDVPSGGNFVAVACGRNHSLALTLDGALAAWGLNNYDQCNVPSGSNFIEIAAGATHSLALRSDGTLIAWGTISTTPSGNGFVDIAAGDYHCLAIKSDGSLAAWGTNSDGQCNVPSGNNFVKVAAGVYHSLAIEGGAANILIIDNPYGMWGNINDYNEIHIVNGGSITVPDAEWVDGTWQGGYLMLEADTIIVEAGGSIHADECGFSKEDNYSDGGPGKGEDIVRFLATLLSADGAGHHGAGGHYQTTVGSGGAPYGVENSDDTYVGTLFGSSGGDYYWPAASLLKRGGRGGGYIRLTGSIVTVNGTITANGGAGLLADVDPPGAGSGGGSGGQIVLDSPDLTVTGSIETKGGNGSSPSELYSSGGGSGGRIKILQLSDNTCEGTYLVSGGNGCSGMGKGANGYVYMAGKPGSPAPTAIDLHPDDDTGIDNSDYLTNLTNPRITGQGAADSLVRLYADGGNVGSGQSDSEGHFTVTASLGNGIHTITATAQQDCHNESDESPAYVIVEVDAQSPNAPNQPDMVESIFYGGKYLDDDITSDASPTFEGVVEPGNEWVLFVDGTEAHRAISSDGNWNWSINPTNEGGHQIMVKAVDNAGNVSGPSPALSIQIDLTNPVISNMQLFPPECVPAGQVFNIWCAVSDAISGVWASKGVDCDLWLSGETYIDSITLDHQGDNQFSGTWDSSGNVAGSYNIDFTAWDIAGNEQNVITGATICLENPTPYCGDDNHPYPAGDLTKDCYVNLDDIAFLAGYWLRIDCIPPESCDGTDFEPDGDVDLADFAVLAESWLDCTNPYPPCSYLP